jgi:trehalose 6-phosphate synthase
MMAQHEDGLVPVEDDNSSYRLRFVDLPPSTYDPYYNVISNPLLWFVHHYLWDTPREPKLGLGEWRAWREGYVVANRAFARVIAEEVGRAEQSPVVMIQDYQLYLVPQALREEYHELVIQFFLHIPFPGPDYLRILPFEMRQAILSSLLSCDIVGFQTKRFADNFLHAAQSFIPGAEVDHHLGHVEYNGHHTFARVYPVSIDPESVRDLAYGEQGQRELEALIPFFGEQNIVRVDRIEPSKNIVHGFEAFDLMLDDHSELRGRVKFLAFLVPPRPGVAEYELYQDEVLLSASKVNLRHGTVRWRPVEMFVGNDYVRALAAMRRHDVLLVNPVIDGMNVVSKEGVIVNEIDGTLVLSEGAGSFEQLSPWVRNCVSPADLSGTAEALYAALCMPAGERRELAERLRASVEQEDTVHWLISQLEDLAALGG